MSNDSSNSLLPPRALPSSSLSPPSSPRSATGVNSALTHGYFVSLQQVWKKRDTLHAADVQHQLLASVQSILRASNSIPDSLLFKHMHGVIEVVEQIQQIRNNPPKPKPVVPTATSTEHVPVSTATSPAESSATTPVSDTTGKPPTPAATSSNNVPPVTLLTAPSPPAASLTIPPYLYHLYLRLLLLLAQRLPTYFRTAWAKEAPPLPTADGVPAPPVTLPAGLDLDSYQSFFDRVSKVAQNIPLPDDLRIQPWDGHNLCISLHLQVLAYFHCPPSNPDVQTTFWHFLEADFLTRNWLVAHLLQYQYLKEITMMIVSLAAAHTDLHRFNKLVLQLVQCWRIDPFLALNDKATPKAPSHSSQHLVQRTPPSLVKHETLCELITFAINNGVQEGRKLKENEQIELERGEKERMERGEAPLSSTISVKLDAMKASIQQLLTELDRQFQLYTRDIDSRVGAPLFQRSLLPVFGVVGILSAVDSSDASNATATGVPEFVTLVTSAKEMLRGMMQFVLNVSEIREAASQVYHDGSSTPASDQSWPCKNEFHVSCSSCLFVLLSSVAIMRCARYMPFITEERITSKEKSEASTSTAIANAAAPIRLFNTAVRLFSRVYFHLVDISWSLNGTQPSSMPATPPPTPQPASSPSSTTSSKPLAAKKTPSGPSILFSWINSPFYQLLPQYARAFAALFLQLQHRPTELQLLAAIWRITRYHFHVWTWYNKFGGGAPNSSKTSGTASSSTSAVGISSPEFEKALNRIQLGAKMEATSNSVMLSPTIPQQSATGGMNAPVRLNKSTLKRAQNSLFMSIIMSLNLIVMDDRWRASTPPLNSNMPASSSTVELSNDSVHQSFIIACIVDTVSQLEFIAKAGAAAGFSPYKQLVTAIVNLATGVAVVDAEAEKKGAAATNTTPVASSTTVARSQNPEEIQQHVSRVAQEIEYRAAFGRSVVAFFLRDFFCVQPTQELPLSAISDAAYMDARPHSGVALPFVLAQSRRPFSRALLSSLRLPSPPFMTGASLPASASQWINPVTKLDVSSVTITDLPLRSRTVFQAGFVSTCMNNSIGFPLQWLYVLPFSFSLLKQPSKSLNKRVHHLLALTLQRAYRVATRDPAALESEKRISAAFPASLPPLPAMPSSTSLESFTRSLFPFTMQLALDLYPAPVTFPSLTDTSLTVFSTLPSNDVSLLYLLSMIEKKITSMLKSLLEDKSQLLHWRQVTDLAAVMAEDKWNEEESSGSDSDDEIAPPPAPSNPGSSEAESSSAIGMQPLPRNVRLPAHFPSLNGVRQLVVLYMQLVQSLDSSLFSRALAQLTPLFVETLNPSVDAIATPLRASIAAVIQQSLTRGFDLSKRETAVDWFMDLSQKLHIPIALRRERKPKASAKSSEKLIVDGKDASARLKEIHTRLRNNQPQLQGRM